MVAALSEAVLQDPIAVSVAQALAIANQTARTYHVPVKDCLISVTQETPLAGETLWRINYGPRDYVHRRGGDLTVYVNDQGLVQKVLRGQ